MTAGGDADSPSVLHELKNHLSVIVGFCDLLLHDLPLDDPKRKDIGEMRRAGTAALALVSELPEDESGG